MVREAPAIDITASPDLARVAREALRTGMLRPLVENGVVIAVVMPPRTRRKPAKVASGAELQRVLAETRGAWRGLIDPEEFKRQRRELQLDDRESHTP